MSYDTGFGASSFGKPPPSSFGAPPPGGQGQVDSEMKSFLEMESQKAQLQQQIHKLNDVCWDLCVDKPREKMDGRTETCLCNCVDRFVDTLLLVAGRFQNLINKHQ
ncbi:mitochondrial import inner membrane translocase subunit Tim8-like [Mytilus trossulus]|uniref:mitochondrial import inner membrane translocase subunit Tim8-like n=1 Tax=Mytilus trossulus TaxID=6551 RepID=UPI003003D906